MKSQEINSEKEIIKEKFVSFLKDGIVFIKLNQGVILTKKDIEDAIDAINFLGKGQKIPVISIAGDDSSADHSARIHSAKKESNRFTACDALVIKSFAQRLIADFYIRVNKPVVPTKVFRSVEDAILWANKYK